MIPAPLHSEAELKEAAVEASSGEIVAVLHADCIPKLDWLRRLVATVRAHPDAAIISGKTTYGDDTLLRRAMAATSRSYLDTGGDGPTRHISHNNAGYWRSSYLALPQAPKIGPFGSVLKAEAILRGRAADFRTASACRSCSSGMEGRMAYTPRIRIWAGSHTSRRPYDAACLDGEYRLSLDSRVHRRANPA